MATDKPSPTQEENDLAALGLNPIVKENPVDEVQPKRSEEQQEKQPEKKSKTKVIEAEKPSAYSTRAFGDELSDDK